MPYKILIVDDDTELLETMHQAMQTWFFDADCVPGSSEALMMMRMNIYDIIITDKNMPGKDGGDEGGMYVLKHAKKLLPAAEVIIMTGHATLDSAIDAIRNGAFDYISKPFLIKELKQKIDRIIEYKSFSSSKESISNYKKLLIDIIHLAKNDYKPEDKELHLLLRSVLDKIDHFFRIQRNTEHAFKNINSHVSKLKRSISPNDPNYEVIFNINREIDDHLKRE